VARLAGVNRGTAYQHFETRDKLIKATAEWVSDKLFRAVFGDPATLGERRVEQVDVADLTDRLANFAMDDPGLCRIWLLQVLSSSDPTSDRLWKEYEGCTARFARTKLAQDNIDTEVLSVITLAGTFLWPVWARPTARGTKTGPASGISLCPGMSAAVHVWKSSTRTLPRHCRPTEVRQQHSPPNIREAQRLAVDTQGNSNCPIAV
jgi:AcrR family transcriptional regulator